MNHTHTYRELAQLWDGHHWCRTWYCTSCPDGARSARIIPVGQGLPEGVTA